MSVTVTYDLNRIIEAPSITFGFATGSVALTSLANGGVFGIGNNGDHLGGAIFSADGVAGPSFETIAGNNASLDQLSNGNVVVASENGAGNIQFQVVSSTTGTTVIGATPITGGGGHSHADLTALVGGSPGFAVAEQQNGDISVSFFNNAGTPGTNVLIDGTAANDHDASIAQLDGGSVVVAWTRTVGAQTEIWYSLLSATGTVLKAATLADTGGTINQNVSVAPLNGGGFALAYEDNQYGATPSMTIGTYSVSGNTVTSVNDFQVNSGQSDTAPDLVRMPNGFLALTTIRGIAFVSIIDPATGNVLAERDVLDSPSGTNPNNPAVAVMGSGQVMVIYDADEITGGQIHDPARVSTVDEFSNGETINGDGMIDIMSGATGGDTLNGAGGNDILFGQLGSTIDTLNGGAGVDTADYSSSQGAVVVALAGSAQVFLTENGNFSAQISNIENVNGGSGNDKLTGDGFRNTLTGNDGNDQLNGGSNADTMIGGGGNDRYIVDSGLDIVDEARDDSSGTDLVISAAININLNSPRIKGDIEQAALTGSFNLSITGNSLNNLLTGNAGGNSLDGGAGNDTMRGLGSSDTYTVNSLLDIVDESVAGSSGTDTVRSGNISIDFSAPTRFRGALEDITLFGALNLNATGNAAVNTIIGNGGGNIIDGRGGNDTMMGLAGNDTYVIDTAGDVVDESTLGSGTDTVKSSTIGISLLNTAQIKGAIEIAQLEGSASLNLTGNSAFNILVGNAGNNVLDSRGGGDVMRGLGGNDQYVLTSGTDSADESIGGSGGIDTVRSATVSINLNNINQIQGPIERAVLIGSAALTAVGSQGNNDLVGNAGNNVLIGLGGRDNLFGGAGADAFVFNMGLNAATNVDHIQDYAVGTDRIRLDDAVFKGIGAPNLTMNPGAFVSGPAATAPGHRIVYNPGDGHLSYDADGSGAGAAILFAILDTHPGLSNADFLVI
jgi:Ca2+-binding RTX toxin-like protein